MQKQIKRNSQKEILRKQLELLAENSKNCTVEELAYLSNSMCKIAGLLYIHSLRFVIAAVIAYAIISIVIHIQ